MKKLNELIAELQAAMESGWDDYANGITPSDEVYDILAEIESMGIGAVYVPTISGRIAWLDVINQEF